MANAPVPAVLVDHYLRAQREPATAVDQFARAHDEAAGGGAALAGRYSALMPASPPGEGQQYAFEVDLDGCSGCKSCVAACHAMNGLEDEESWRDVGLLHGGGEGAPVMQHVTTACHHCLDPACMHACPVDAYEKDPATGIVRHLDDQCFGCQYCTLACPYDAPKYSAAKGIVRKCDMCSDRLAEGEAPACVQSCPGEAIRIRVVDANQVVEESETNLFVPGAPEPEITLPATTYRTGRVLPRNMIPADDYSVNPTVPHWPLIVMLALTQLSVGAFLVEQVLGLVAPAALMASIRPLHSASALVFGLLALAVSVLPGPPAVRLPRRHRAAPLVVEPRDRGVRALRVAVDGRPPRLRRCGPAVARMDGGRRRPSRHRLLGDGLPVHAEGLLERLVDRLQVPADGDGARARGRVALAHGHRGVDGERGGLGGARSLRPGAVPGALIAAAAFKLVFEAALFRYLAATARSTTSLKRTALLMSGPLSQVTAARFEAAKAAHDLGLETHVIEFMPRLMPRQVDDAGSRLLVEEIEKLGVRVRLGAATKAILGNGRVDYFAERRAAGV